MSVGAWRNSCYIVDGSILGTVEQGFGRWLSFACVKEWNDMRLGDYPNQEEAQDAVEEWVDEIDE